jgi:hypothetical protein
MEKIATTIRIESNLLKKAKQQAILSNLSLNTLFVKSLVEFLASQHNKPVNQQKTLDDIAGAFTIRDDISPSEVQDAIERYKNGGFLKEKSDG